MEKTILTEKIAQRSSVPISVKKEGSSRRYGKRHDIDKETWDALHKLNASIFRAVQTVDAVT